MPKRYPTFLLSIIPEDKPRRSLGVASSDKLACHIIIRCSAYFNKKLLRIVLNQSIVFMQAILQVSPFFFLWWVTHSDPKLTNQETWRRTSSSVIQSKKHAQSCIVQAQRHHPTLLLCQTVCITKLICLLHSPQPIAKIHNNFKKPLIFLPYKTRKQATNFVQELQIIVYQIELCTSLHTNSTIIFLIQIPIHLALVALHPWGKGEFPWDSSMHRIWLIHLLLHCLSSFSSKSILQF